jgi:hypothetical protein
VSCIRLPFRAATQARLGQLSEFVDTHARDLLLSDRLLFKKCPNQWSDSIALDLLPQMLGLYTNAICVKISTLCCPSPRL